MSAFTVNMDIIYVRFCNGVHSGRRMAASVIAREYYVMRGLLALDKISEHHEGEVFNHCNLLIGLLIFFRGSFRHYSG